jgi:VWFA-related protein
VRPGSGFIAFSAAAFVASVLAVPSAQQAVRDQGPPIRSGVEVVSVDVGVVDGQGRPVRGLEPPDFTVTVGGQPRRVVSAEYVDAAAARPDEKRPAEVVPISTNEGAGVGRLFVFVVDQNTIEPGNVRNIANAAKRFLSGLSYVDRSALMIIPTGPNVAFTWAHDRVQTALQRVTGLSSLSNPWEFGSLSEARDIANRNPSALRSVGQRECGSGGISASGGGFDPIGPVAPPAPGGSSPTAPAGGGTQGGGQTGGGSGTGSGGSGSGQGRSSSGSRGGGADGMGLDSCSRDLQMRAEMTWRTVQMTSLASLTALRQALATLAQVRGDKTVVLISGGWPLDDRDQISLLSTVAGEAAAARATIFTLYVPETQTSVVSRRLVSTTSMSDSFMHWSPLQDLSGMTGGRSYRAEVGVEGVFDRLSRELSGYYRLAVEKTPADLDGKSRHLKVQVSRSSVTVRARDIFDTRNYEDRDWAARLSSALDGPIPATGIGLRVTSYVAPDPDDTRVLKLVLTGEASRLDPGEATFQVMVRDLEGKKIAGGERPLGEPNGDGLSFSTNIAVPPGSYMVRVAVADGGGHVGSVDHRVDVKPTKLGTMSGTGPMLIRIPPGRQDESRLALNDVRQDERLAVQVDLEGNGAVFSEGDVVFEIAGTSDGPALVQTVANLAIGSHGVVMAQGLADVRLLPPGDYVLRAKVKTGGEPVGELRRAFSVREAARPAVTPTTGSANVSMRPAASTRTAPRLLSSAPPFALDQVLAPKVVGTFLDRVAARPDAGAPGVRELVERARSGGIDGLTVSDSLAKESPVASFLRGLTLLSQKQLEPAAQAFRNAMRVSADFYPAMVYLGACYAAGGKDNEAAGAWRTALIKEGETLPLHVLLIDAQLRLDRGDLALEAVERAQDRWPTDDGLKKRFVMGSLLAGKNAEGLQALDELIDASTDDEPLLMAAMLVLYEAVVNDRPIESLDQDRARMARLADTYRKRGGASQALIDTWMTAAAPKKK